MSQLFALLLAVSVSLSASANYRDDQCFSSYVSQANFCIENYPVTNTCSNEQFDQCVVEAKEALKACCDQSDSATDACDDEAEDLDDVLKRIETSCADV